MSASLPNNDTFENHFNELISLFEPPEHLFWAHILVGEERSIMWGKITYIPKSVLVLATDYEKRFDELLSKGYDWINMNAMGILQYSFIVLIEFPLKSLNASRDKVSVNYSGPAIFNKQPLWDLSNKVKILE